MEIFIDFGLFELLAATGFAFIARKIYTRRRLGLGFIIVSLIAPIFLVFFATEGLAKWIAAACLATTLVNGSLIFMLLQRGNISALLDKNQSAKLGVRT
jgi:hypothetical protein